jgi:hypothetical protein
MAQTDRTGHNDPHLSIPIVERKQITKYFRRQNIATPNATHSTYYFTPKLFPILWEVLQTLQRCCMGISTSGLMAEIFLLCFENLVIINISQRLTICLAQSPLYVKQKALDVQENLSSDCMSQLRTIWRTWAWGTRDECLRIDNSAGQFWKRLSVTKNCNATRRRR